MWYDYLTGNEIPVAEYCDGTALDSKLKLKFPEMTVEQPVIDRPLIWYKVVEYNCQQGIAINNEERTEQFQTLKEDNLTIESNNEIRISPNPFNSELNISLSEVSEYWIYDANKMIVTYGVLNAGHNNLVLNSLAKGIYFLKLSGNNYIYKLVKN